MLSPQNSNHVLYLAQVPQFICIRSIMDLGMWQLIFGCIWDLLIPGISAIQTGLCLLYISLGQLAVSSPSHFALFSDDDADFFLNTGLYYTDVQDDLTVLPRETNIGIRQTLLFNHCHFL